MFDREMRYLGVSQRWLQDYGLNGREILGRSHYEVFPEISQKWKAVHSRALLGETIRAEEEEFVRADGKSQWLKWEVRPWQGDDSAIGGVIIFSEDVTARKRAEAELREREARFRAIFNTAVDAIVVADESGAIREVNPATQDVFGYRQEELVGQSVEMLMPEPYRSELAEQMRTYLRGRASRAGGVGWEVEGLRKDGSTFPLDIALTMWRDSEGRRRLTAITRDISERKRAEETLAKASRLDAVAQLAGGVAHDANNLLALIAGNLDFAEQRIEDPAARMMVRRAREAVEMGARLTRRLLALGRSRELSPQPIDINRRIVETLELVKRTLYEQTDVAVALDPALWPTLADPNDVDSALMNLVLNSRDAMPGGGTLRISTVNASHDKPPEGYGWAAGQGDFVQLAVTDNGAGMSSETLARALEPFFTTKGPDKGTGLGLSSVADFAKRAGGFVTLESEPGCGTTVTLHLPRAARPTPFAHEAEPSHLH